MAAWTCFQSFFDKKTSGATSSGGIKNENMSDQQIAEELYKPIIGNLKIKKVYSFLYKRFGVLIFLICS